MWITHRQRKDDDSVALGRNEAEHEDVLAATVVALRRGLSKGDFLRAR